jgi:hypothetical protein
MTATTHHEIHPDAEMLSAFVEQTLSAKERGDVLKHLAVCARCRNVVALAGEAAGAEVDASRHKIVQPRTWWRSWGLALAPAVAATAVIAIYVRERGVERTAEVAKLEQMRAGERPATPSQAAPQVPEQAGPTPASPAEKPTPTERPGEPARRATPKKQTQVVFFDPGGGKGGPILTTKEERELERALKEPASPTAESHGSMGAAHAPSGAPPDEKTEPEVALYDEERIKHAEEAAEDRRQFAAKAPMSSSDHGSGSDKAAGGAPGNNEPVDVSALQLEIQPASTAGHLQLHGMRSMVDIATGPSSFLLPSGRPAVSIASADHRTLAVDEKGTLFLREDSSGTWEKVKQQWTGRATVVRRRAPESGATGAMPAPETGESPAASGALSQPGTVFELVNDQGQVWISADGRIWTSQ